MTNSDIPAGNKLDRVLLKLSGEFLAGEAGFGIDRDVLSYLANEICEALALGVQICLLVGGGNFYRGVSSGAKTGVERASADYMGMLATVINALALQDALEKASLQCRVLSAISMTTVCEPYIRRRAIRHLEKGRVVIFAAGTGNPFFTTDTAAALRAIEMGCDTLLKGTNVDGVYSGDPRLNKDAVKYNRLTYHQVLNEDLRAMDHTAISLAKDNNLPIVVFGLKNKGALCQILSGSYRNLCTTIHA